MKTKPQSPHMSPAASLRRFSSTWSVCPACQVSATSEMWRIARLDGAASSSVAHIALKATATVGAGWYLWLVIPVMKQGLRPTDDRRLTRSRSATSLERRIHVPFAGTSELELDACAQRSLPCPPLGQR